MMSLLGSKKRGVSTLTALVTLMLASSCYTTTVRSGKPPAEATIEYDGKWHSGLVWGLAELSGPYDLSEICPQGWAEITTETSFVNGLVDAVTSSIYSPQSVTVRCAAGGQPSKPESAKKKAAPTDDAPAEPDDAAEDIE